MNNTEFSRTDLTELQRQLVAWRERQHGRPRLPEDVWIAAATLARSQGVSLVARTLRLDYYRLGRHCASPQVVTPRVDGSPGFVELHIGDAVPDLSGSFRIELTGPHGVGMTIGLGHDTSAVVALAEAFWKRIP